VIPDLDRVLEPDYLAGVAEAPIDRIRAMRAECADLENGVSYVRRLAQGRLDLLAEETKRRAAGGGGDLADLVADLADLMSDGVRAPASGRVDQQLDPPDHVVEPLSAVLDDTVGPAIVAGVADIDDPALAGAITSLRHFEERLSGIRRSLHNAIDVLNNELARRIVEGEPPSGQA